MMALATGEDADSYTTALHDFFKALPRPKAIVIVSAHGTSAENTVEISAAEHPRIIHDFSHFPAELYQMDYPCPGSPEVAVQVATLLSTAGFETELIRTRLMDHGAWIPLRIAYPEADIPVVQISMPFGGGPASVLKLGKALATLRDEGVLLIASGGAVHNTELMVWHMKSGPGEEWARVFQEWLKHMLKTKDVQALIDFEDEAPHAKLAQPTPKHFYPVFFAVGASLPGDEAHTIFEGIQYQTLSTYAFALS